MSVTGLSKALQAIRSATSGAGNVLGFTGPLGGAAVGMSAAAFAGEAIGGPALRGVGGLVNGGNRIGKAAGQEARLQAMARGEAMRQARMRELMAQNTMRLATQHPDIYNSVMAGRRLPRGTVVIGGQPRIDDLQRVAMAMSDDTLSGLSNPTGV